MSNTSISRQIREEGLSLRTLHTILFILAFLVPCFLIYLTTRLSFTYLALSRATDQYIEMHKAASELMDASGYLTEMAQRYTLDGNSLYLHNYFDEALEDRRREKAIERMRAFESEHEAVAQLQHALEESARLKELDYYAMRLVVDAVGVYPVPEALQDIELRPEHASLAAAEKKVAARHIVSDEAYYRIFDRVRAEMRQSLDKLEEGTRTVQQRSTARMRAGLVGVRLAVIIQAVVILLGIWLTARLGISPVLKAAEEIRADRPIPVTGAREFRYLARTYNKMYEIYKRNVSSLRFKASHDRLTQVYNRAGYDLLLENQDLKTTGILLADVDLFKQVNDVHGHEAGDRVLRKVASVLTASFRAEDCVCRIGGDEFVVIMPHADSAAALGIPEKVERINRALADTADGLPPVSVSAGFAHGSGAENAKELYEHEDHALYESKRAGRKRVSVYELRS